jgi:hypothetical protein
MRAHCAGVVLSFVGLLALASASSQPENNMGESATAIACPDGWDAFGEHCYQMIWDYMMFKDAENYCQSLGGHLPSVHSLAENNFIHHFHTSGSTLLGATRSATGVIIISFLTFLYARYRMCTVLNMKHPY